MNYAGVGLRFVAIAIDTTILLPVLVRARRHERKHDAGRVRR